MALAVGILPRPSRLFGLTLTVLYACKTPGAGSAQVKVVGGAQVAATDPVEQSTVIWVWNDGKTDIVCSGTLIDMQHVLTVAHCLNGTIPSNIKVGFGPTPYAAGSTWLAATAYPNPDFSFPLNDTNLLALQTNAPTGSVPAAILAPTATIPVGHAMTVAGYGVTATGTATPGVLRKASVKIAGVDSTAHLLTYGTAGNTYVGACRGDAGGPNYLMLSDGIHYLAAITSGGSDGCTGPGTALDIRPYEQWLADALAQHGEYNPVLTLSEQMTSATAAFDPRLSTISISVKPQNPGVYTVSGGGTTALTMASSVMTGQGPVTSASTDSHSINVASTGPGSVPIITVSPVSPGISVAVPFTMTATPATTVSPATTSAPLNLSPDGKMALIIFDVTSLSSEQASYALTVSNPNATVTCYGECPASSRTDGTSLQVPIGTIWMYDVGQSAQLGKGLIPYLVTSAKSMAGTTVKVAPTVF